MERKSTYLLAYFHDQIKNGRQRKRAREPVKDEKRVRGRETVSETD